MEENKVSIIVPIYNVSEYLDKCLENIIEQTYNNIEIILVDDGSTDDSGRKCDSYARLDERIKVIHKENGGLSSARNAGLDICTGNYIVFVDSDDWISKFMVEKLVNKLIKSKSDIVCCEFFEVDEKTLLCSKIDAEEKIMESEEALEKLLKLEIRDYAWNKIYKRELFSELRFPDGRNYEDMATTYRAFMQANKVCVIPDLLYYYVTRNGSIANTSNTEKILKNKYDAMISYYERIETISQQYPQLRELTICKFFDRAISFIEFIDIIKKNNNAIKWRKETIKYLNKYYEEYKLSKKVSKKRLFKVKILVKNNIDLSIFYKRVKKILPKTIKNFIVDLLTKIKIISASNRNFIEKSDLSRLFLIGTPDHDNLGDHAIAEATLKLISETVKDKEIVEVTEQEFVENIQNIKRCVKKEDIILIQGGGNWGNTYKYIDKIHKQILKNFYKNRIIVIPQTIYYSNDKNGKKSLKKDIKLIKKCKEIIFFIILLYSYEYVKNTFNIDKVFLVPDIVLSMKECKNCGRNGALICLRSDKEGKIKKEDKLWIHKFAEKKYSDMIVTDTCIGTRVSKKERMIKLRSKWNQLCHSEIIFTDRLHGMIFAAITGTPCIVFGNFNHKVKCSYEWLKDLNYIEFVNGIEEVENAVKRLDKCDINTYNKPFEEKYKLIKNFLIKDN